MKINNNKNNFNVINFIINIVYIIFISISLIHHYDIIALVSTIVWGFLLVLIRYKYFNRVKDWPSLRPILILLIVIMAGVYISVLLMENINNYIKYIVFATMLIIYVSIYLKFNKK